MASPADQHGDRLESAWRLALALCLGDAARAERVVDAALAAQPDLSAIPADRVERLIVLRARAAGGGSAPRDGVNSSTKVAGRLALRERVETMRARHRAKRGVDSATQIQAKSSGDAAPTPGGTAADAASTATAMFGALAPLDEQPREAWALIRVFHRNLRWASRAMDCSTTAVARHLAQADDALLGLLGDGAGALPASLRDWLASETFDGLRRLRSRVRGRRRRRRIGWIVRSAAAVAVILAIVLVIVIILLRGSASPT